MTMTTIIRHHRRRLVGDEGDDQKRGGGGEEWEDEKYERERKMGCRVPENVLCDRYIIYIYIKRAKFVCMYVCACA